MQTAKIENDPIMFVLWKY